MGVIPAVVSMKRELESVWEGGCGLKPELDHKDNARLDSWWEGRDR